VIAAAAVVLGCGLAAEEIGCEKWNWNAISRDFNNLRF
jgi:hypothetical protein